MAGRGVQDLALNRIPEKWDRQWFGRFIREVLALADARNSIGEGLTISGQPNEVATFSLSADLLALLSQPFVLAQPSGFLAFERTLAGDEGVHVVDGGPNANITVKLLDNGVNLGKLQQLGAWSVLSNPTNALGNVQSVQASNDGEVFSLQGTTLAFTLTPVWRGDHTWADGFAVRLGTDGDLNIEHSGAAGFIENATGVLTIDSDAGVDILATAGTMNLTASGAVTVESTTGALQLRAATSFKVRTAGVDRFEIDSTGAWLLAGSAGTAGQVPTSAGAGAPVAWAAGGGGGSSGTSGVWEHIADYVAGSAATNITLTGLDLDRDECYFLMVDLTGAAAGAATMAVFFNGDTTATNYERSLNTTTGDASIFGGLDNGAPATWNAFVRRDPVTGRVTWSAQGGRIITTASIDYSSSVIWDTAANLTSLTINSSVAAQIAAGSRVRLFRVKGSGSHGSNSAYQFVGESIVAGAAATTITVAGLNLDTDEQYEVEVEVDNGSGSTALVSLFYNADTTATNYDKLMTTGAANTSANNAELDGFFTTEAGRYRISIAKDFDGNPRAFWSLSRATGANMFRTGTHRWRTATNVTSLTISSSIASAFSIGSYVRVWKVLRKPGGTTDVQTFNAGGTWTKPPGARMVDVVCIAPGGGGGSGRKGATSTARCAGGSGGGGGYSRLMIPASLCAATETVTLGAAGTGGAAQATDSTNGVAGSAGGNAAFGSFIKATGGGAGGAGTTAGGSLGAAGLGLVSDGGIGAIGAGAGGSTVPTQTKMGGGGGGTAAGVTAANGVGTGSVGADGPSLANTTISGGTAGGSPGASGGNGSSGAAFGIPGAGGGGGAGNATGGGSGGTGGNGGTYGAGGGGGGGCTNGAGSSGKGGDGAAGIVVVVTYF